MTLIFVSIAVAENISNQKSVQWKKINEFLETGDKIELKNDRRDVFTFFRIILQVEQNF